MVVFDSIKLVVVLLVIAMITDVAGKLFLSWDEQRLLAEIRETRQHIAQDLANDEVLYEKADSIITNQQNVQIALEAIQLQLGQQAQDLKIHENLAAQDRMDKEKELESEREVFNATATLTDILDANITASDIEPPQPQPPTNVTTVPEDVAMGERIVIGQGNTTNSTLAERGLTGLGESTDVPGIMLEGSSRNQTTGGNETRQ